MRAGTDDTLFFEIEACYSRTVGVQFLSRLCVCPFDCPFYSIRVMKRANVEVHVALEKERKEAKSSKR